MKLKYSDMSTPCLHIKGIMKVNFYPELTLTAAWYSLITLIAFPVSISSLVITFEPLLNLSPIRGATHRTPTKLISMTRNGTESAITTAALQTLWKCNPQMQSHTFPSDERQRNRHLLRANLRQYHVSLASRGRRRSSGGVGRGREREASPRFVDTSPWTCDQWDGFFKYLCMWIRPALLSSLPSLLFLLCYCYWYNCCVYSYFYS